MSKQKIKAGDIISFKYHGAIYNRVYVDYTHSSSFDNRRGDTFHLQYMTDLEFHDDCKLSAYCFTGQERDLILREMKRLSDVVASNIIKKLEGR